MRCALLDRRLTGHVSTTCVAALFQNLFRNRFSAAYRALYTGGEYELNVTSPPRPACQVPWLPEP